MRQCLKSEQDFVSLNNMMIFMEFVCKTNCVITGFVLGGDKSDCPY